jgi:hypothetical protein
MAKKVNIKCAHCGEAQELVHDTAAIPGVPGTYVSAGEEQHLNSVKHASEVMFKESIDKGLRDMGMKPHDLKESATGRLEEFGHGKEHNA